MKLPGLVKFILFSAVIYQILTLKPVKKLVLGFLVTAAASYMKKILNI